MFLLVKLQSSLRKLFGHHHVLINRYIIYVSKDQGHVPFVVITIQSSPHSWLVITFVKKKLHIRSSYCSIIHLLLLSLTSHIGEPYITYVKQVLYLCVVFCLLFCRSMFVNFLLAIVLPFLLWLTSSDYPLISSMFSDNLSANKLLVYKIDVTIKPSQETFTIVPIHKNTCWHVKIFTLYNQILMYWLLLR